MMTTRSAFRMAVPVLAVVATLNVSFAALGDNRRPIGGGGKLPQPAQEGEFQHPRNEVVELGQQLFFDKELSGNRNISCATCHSPVVGTVDGLSTNIGTGGEGLSVLRNAGKSPLGPRDPLARGARNMSPLFNLGHEQFTTLFWDGRVQVDESYPQGFLTPAREDLPMGFDTPLAALSVFAQADQQEMLGKPGTNEMADASLSHPHLAVWEAMMERLRAIPEYVELFSLAFSEVGGNPDEMTIVQVGNALGAFQASAFRSDDSPFDRYLRGDIFAVSPRARHGAKLFYGAAKCSTCHSGVFQTDHAFHSIGMPQVGPGFGDGEDGCEDFGRQGVTGDPADRYQFRTPSLRNVALTGPWGHDGAFESVEAAVRHHLDANGSLANYDPSQIVMPSRPDLDARDRCAVDDPAVTASIASSVEVWAPKRVLSDLDIADLLHFMEALTGTSAHDTRDVVPKRVPSGLPLAEIK